jgi:hypothetical protein
MAVERLWLAQALIVGRMTPCTIECFAVAFPLQIPYTTG